MSERDLLSLFNALWQLQPTISIRDRLLTFLILTVGCLCVGNLWFKFVLLKFTQVLRTYKLVPDKNTFSKFILHGVRRKLKKETGHGVLIRWMAYEEPTYLIGIIPKVMFFEDMSYVHLTL